MFFDGSLTTGTASTRPFHDFIYVFDFNDPTSGTWANGSNPGVNNKNVAAGGPLGAHVFETPGTYTVCMSVFDGTNTAQTSAVITVADPNVVFVGSTVCVSDNNTFVGCPAGASQVNSSDFTAAINTTALNGATFKRILFRRGGSYTAASQGVIDVTGPGHLGVFPTSGAGLASVSGPGSKIQIGSGTNPLFGDWRFTDLQLSGSGGAQTAIGHAGTSAQVTIMRMSIDQAQTGIEADLNVLDAHNNPVFSQSLYSELALVDNTITNSTDYNIFVAGTKMMVLGNSLNNATLQHGMRSQYSRLSVLSNNTFGTAQRTSLTVRGTEHLLANRQALGATGRFTLGDMIFTELGVISDNRLNGGNTTVPFTLKTSNDTEDDRFRNFVVERNTMVMGTSGLTPFFQTEASEITIRNNLVDTTAAGAGQIAFGLSKSTGTPSPADAIFVYNNTHFSNKGGASIFITLDAFPASNNPPATPAPTNVKVKNNLGYAPGNTNVGTASDRGPYGAGGDVQANSTGTQIKTINPFAVAVPSPNTPTQWIPTGASYAANTGVAVPVWSDFFLGQRTGPYDLGAANLP